MSQRQYRSDLPEMARSWLKWTGLDGRMMEEGGVGSGNSTGEGGLGSGGFPSVIAKATGMGRISRKVMATLLCSELC